MTQRPPAEGLTAHHLALDTSSFVEFLRRAGCEQSAVLAPSAASGSAQAPHGTTIVAVRYAGGVVMAGDRRATVGNLIAQRDIEKVFAADSHSVVGIAGTAGVAVELVRLLQLELEHYEKIEGVPLSMMGKANRLSSIIRGNLDLAMQGLAAVPLLAGFDPGLGRGRIFSYDVTGGRYEEHDFYAVGSGSTFARGALKKLHRPDAPVDDAIRVCLESLFDAADDDAATGGPDPARGIFPLVAVVDSAGARMVAEPDIAAAAATVITDRSASPDGPKVPFGESATGTHREEEGQ